VRFVQAAARAAGLTWTPPENLERITVSGRAGEIAPQTVALTHASATGVAAVRRGELVTLVYAARGIELTTRARATGDAAVGERVQLVNLQSNRTIEATVTGPATASANLTR
jgi:flagella basal body P-ring formation protein FlgA